MKHSSIRSFIVITSVCATTSLGAWFIGTRDAWVVQITLTIGFILGFSFGQSTGIMAVNEIIREVINERTGRS